MNLLRFLLVPGALALTVGVIATTMWLEYSALRGAAVSFRKNSKITEFTFVGEKSSSGKAFPTYEYEEDGDLREFSTYSPLPLGPDRLVRLGPRPILKRDKTIQWSSGELAIAIDRKDSLGPIYYGISGKNLKDDQINLALVSAVALFAIVAGFYIQRKIFGSLNRATKSRRGN